jgi:hypothetical protein
MSLKSLKARLAKIPTPDLESAQERDWYGFFKTWSWEEREEYRQLLREHDELRAQEEARQERERRRQAELRAPAEDRAIKQALINRTLQKLRNEIAALKAKALEAETPSPGAKDAPLGGPHPDRQTPSPPAPALTGTRTKKQVIRTPAARDPTAPSSGPDSIGSKGRAEFTNSITGGTESGKSTKTHVKKASRDRRRP